MIQSHKQALLLLKKSANDEALIDLILPHKNISDDIFGFNCQQAAEKLLKALLSSMAIPYKKTHNLRVLADLLADNGKPLPPNLQQIDILSPYGTLLRYEEINPPLPSVDRIKFRDLIRQLREWVTPLIV